LSWEDAELTKTTFSNMLNEVAISKDDFSLKRVQLSVYDLPNGLYFIQAYNEDGEMLHMKPFVKIN